jgi:hypothetical protein
VGAALSRSAAGAPARTYRTLGFRETGERADDGEIVAGLALACVPDP